MCDVLKKLNYESELTYRRCGEIVVAPERNIFALYCNLCEDFFMHMQEFVRHARRHHDDEYEFEIGDEDNIYAYGMEEILDGMTWDDIDAVEKAEWERRKKFGQLYEEKFEETNIEGHLGVAEVPKQVADLSAEQETLFPAENAIDASEADRKRSINEVEIEITLDQELKSPDEDNLLLDESGMQIQKNVFYPTEKTLQLTDGYIDKNIEHPKDNLISENSMNSSVLENFDIIKNSTEHSLLEEHFNSSMLENNDLENVQKSTTATMLEDMDLDDFQKTNEIFTTDEKTKSSLDQSDLQCNKNISSTKQENTNSVLLETPDLCMLKNSNEYMILEANMESLVPENTDLEDLQDIIIESSLLENTDLADLQKNAREIPNIYKNVKNTKDLLFSDKNMNPLKIESFDLITDVINESSLLENINLADLEKNIKEFSNTEEKLKSLPLGNLDMADLQHSIKESSILKENTNSLNLENPDLADLLTEFNTDLDSFDMDIFEKFTTPEKILTNNTEHCDNIVNSETPKTFQNEFKDIFGDADMCGEVSRKFVTAGDKSNKPKKRGRPRKVNKDEKEGNSAESTKFQKSVLKPKVVTEINVGGPKPFRKYCNENNLNNSTNIKSKTNKKFCGKEININADNNSKLSISPIEKSKTHGNENLSTIKTPIIESCKKLLQAKSPDESNKIKSTKKVSEVKTSIKINSKNVNDTIKEFQKSPDENSKTHANENPSMMKTVIRTIISPDEINKNVITKKVTKVNSPVKINSNNVNDTIKDFQKLPNEKSKTRANENPSSLKTPTIESYEKLLPIKFPDESNKIKSNKKVSKVKTQIKINSKNDNDTIKEFQKSPDESSKTHANENPPTMKTPIIEACKKLLSPEEGQFHKTLKVRIKKFSPSPKENETNNNKSNLKVLDSKSEISSEPDKVLSKSTTNLSEPILKSVDGENSTKGIKNLDSIGKIQNQPCGGNNKKRLKDLRIRKASIDVLPQTENIIETPLTKNKNSIRNKTISRTTHKHLVLERMTQIRKRIDQMLDEERVNTKLNDKNIIHKDKPNKIEIQNVTTLQPMLHSPFFNDYKTPMVKIDRLNKIKDENQLIVDTSTTQIKDRKPVSCKSEKISQKKSPKHLVVSDLEARKHDLSNSTETFLQNDSSQNKIKFSQLNSILKQDISEADANLAKLSKNESNSESILEGILDKVDVTKKQNAHEQKMLDKINLNFIKMPQGEIPPPMNKSNEMHSKTKNLGTNLVNPKKVGQFITRMADEEQAKTEVNVNDKEMFKREYLKFTKNVSDNCKEKPQKLEIQNITILQTSNSTNSEPLPSFDVFKKPIFKIKDKNQFISNASTAQITNGKSLLNHSLKKEKISPKNTPKQSDVAGLEVKKLDLSNSAAAFGQENSETDEILTKQSKNESNSSSFLEELLHQVAKEEIENKQSVQCELKDKNMDDIKKRVDYEHELLDKIGLSFIKMSPAEILPVAKEAKMYSKAKRFAAILENNSTVWDTKNFKHKIAEERELCFNFIKQKVNCDLAVSLNLTDIKRVCNLVMSWFTNQYNSQLIDKKYVPKTLKLFIELFMFLPKTGRLLYNCEFCDEQFRSENTYIVHRCTHTGGSPYNCVYCSKGFTRQGAFRAHVSKHEAVNELKNEPGEQQIEQQHAIPYSPLATYNVMIRNKSKRQHSPEANEIKNDTKKHKVEQKRLECNNDHEKSEITENLHALKKTKSSSMYKCKICEKILPSIVEIQNHVQIFHKQKTIRRTSVNKL